MIHRILIVLNDMTICPVKTYELHESGRLKCRDCYELMHIDMMYLCSPKNPQFQGPRGKASVRGAIEWMELEPSCPGLWIC